MFSHFVHLYICLQIIVLKPCNRRSKKLQSALSLLLTMPRPIVLTENFKGSSWAEVGGVHEKYVNKKIVKNINFSDKALSL